MANVRKKYSRIKVYKLFCKNKQTYKQQAREVKKIERQYVRRLKIRINIWWLNFILYLCKK